jgi:hypothetical protein
VLEDTQDADGSIEPMGVVGVADTLAEGGDAVPESFL